MELNGNDIILQQFNTSLNIITYHIKNMTLSYNKKKTVLLQPNSVISYLPVVYYKKKNRTEETTDLAESGIGQGDKQIFSYFNTFILLFTITLLQNYIYKKKY